MDEGLVIAQDNYEKCVDAIEVGYEPDLEIRGLP